MNKSYSFEFFPPKTDKGRNNLKKVRDHLAVLQPEFFSVTYGAGGSTQDCTLRTVVEIQQEADIQAAPHLSCVSASKDEIRELLDTYHENNISRIVALRGDLPSGVYRPGELAHASDLVRFIREESGDHFHIEVAAYPEMHPQAPDFKTDIDNFVNKIKMGGDSAITQYFYNPDGYFRFVESCLKRGVEAPIVPGIMPITNIQQLARFSDATGAEIPRWLRKRLEGYGDDLESIQKLGLEFVTGMCEKLLQGGAPGLHFYSMNKAAPSLEIWNNLGLSNNP